MEVWDPIYYSNNSRIQTENAVSLLESSIDFVKPCGSVLDVGCGDGKLTTKISEILQSNFCVGIDLSQDMIDYAQSKYSNKKNIEFIAGDINKITYENMFDTITSFNCIHWIINHNLLFKKFYYALKENGRAFILTYSRNNLFWEVIDQLSLSSKWKHIFQTLQNNFSSSTLNDYKLIFKKNGFKCCYISSVEKEEIFKNMSEFCDYIKGWLPHLSILNKSQQVVFLDDFSKLYLQKNLGGCTFNYEQINLILEKPKETAL